MIENVGDFEGLPAEGQVARLIKAARRAGVPVLAEADTVTAPGAWQLYAELKTARAGHRAAAGGDRRRSRCSALRFRGSPAANSPWGAGSSSTAGRLTRVQVAFPDGH